MNKYDIVVAGGGAAGLMAAVFASMYAPYGTGIIVLEHKDTIGKKLMATGNGRCNFTNDIIDDMSYRGSDSSFAYQIIEQYNKDWLIQTLRSLGIIHTSINGYYYPRSLQARTVVDCMAGYLNSHNVTISCNTNVINIKQVKDGYRIICEKNEYMCSKVILAFGGCSYSKLGSDGSGYKLVEKLGHTITPVFPSLIGLKAEGLDFKLCQGVRAKCSLSLCVDDEIIIKNTGEVQFAEYGISGIPVFQISRYASEALDSHKKVSVSIDLVTEYTYKEIVRMMSDIAEANPGKTVIELLNALIPLKLARAILYRINIKPNKEVSLCSSKEINNLALIVKDLTIDIAGDCGFDKAQVTAGGVLTKEVNEDTMESKLCNGLYITGELLDIDGNCGGYNLHFAFATGAIAGMNAALNI